MNEEKSVITGPWPKQDHMAILTTGMCFRLINSEAPTVTAVLWACPFSWAELAVSQSTPKNVALNIPDFEQFQGLWWRVCRVEAWVTQRCHKSVTALQNAPCPGVWWKEENKHGKPSKHSPTFDTFILPTDVSQNSLPEQGALAEDPQVHSLPAPEIPLDKTTQ